MLTAANACKSNYLFIEWLEQQINIFIPQFVVQEIGTVGATVLLKGNITVIKSIVIEELNR